MAVTQRTTDTVYVFSMDDMEMHEAIVLNQQHLTKLAQWVCENSCQTESRMRAIEREQRGFCVKCGNEAAWLLMQCPYIDMERNETASEPAAA
jgi:hypothetical protein